MYWTLHINFIPVFLASTALHLSLRRYLSKEQRKVVIETVESAWEWIYHVIFLNLYLGKLIRRSNLKFQISFGHQGESRTSQRAVDEELPSPMEIPFALLDEQLKDAGELSEAVAYFPESNLTKEILQITWKRRFRMRT